MPESYPMNGGNGTYSYTKNSYYQKTGINAVKGMVSEAIEGKLDVISFSSSSNSFRLADLGCSVGPNTFTAMQNIIEAVQHKYQSQCLVSEIPEFQVFFNDQDSNDFNTLFTSMPKERRYYAAGVPGSFYDRLFPQSFLHFAYSSYALHWLSRVPEELLDKNSPAWNKGKIHYTNASDAVVDAYAAQFTKDMEGFLDARGKEIVCGGMMVLITLGCPDGMPYSNTAAGVTFDCVGSCLNDMIKDGLLSEDLVDSFNIPIYAPSPMEITELVERNGCFSIERLVVSNFRTEADSKVDLGASVMHLRAGFEWIISKHFGNDIIEDLFDRLHKNVKESFQLFESSYKGGTQEQLQAFTDIKIHEAIMEKLDTQDPVSKLPEFQVFYNDQAFNDFNTLFASLPPERPYFAAGVPGVFLRPVISRVISPFCSFLLCITVAIQDTRRAQFAKDMLIFLDARAKELVAGGMMVLIIPSSPDEIPNLCVPSGVMFDPRGNSKVDSFNLSIYAASPKKMNNKSVI
ncbi:hypothetical protein REPUB_Repub04eG0225100 [Reevesia pubescens]